jgi:hypothetical protein
MARRLREDQSGDPIMRGNFLDASAAARRWQLPDFVAILVSVSLIGTALYGGGIVWWREASQIRDLDAVWIVHFLIGALGIAAVGLAQTSHWRRAGRITLLVCGIILLSGLGAFFRFGWLAWLTFGLPGIILILLARFVGPLGEPPQS